MSRRGQGLISAVGVVSTGFTTLCCLGLTAALSFASSLGAVFLTRDSGLRPALIVSLGIATAGAALTYRRHRRTPVPLILTIGAGLWVYTLVFGVTGHAMHDHMGDATAVHSHVHHFGARRQALIWAGLAVLVGAQAWDLRRARQARTAAVAPA